MRLLQLFTRKAGRHVAQPAPRPAPTGMYWLVATVNGHDSGQPFPTRDEALAKFDRQSSNGLRMRVVSDKVWQGMQHGPRVCTGVTWAEVVEKKTHARPPLCGWAWPHSKHRVKVQPESAAAVPVVPGK